MHAAQPADGQYRRLDPARIVVTAERLARRIEERFPEAGLARVAAEVLEVCREVETTLAGLREPIIGLRLLTWFGLAVLLFVVVGLIGVLRPALGVDDLPELLQAIDAGINDVAFLGLAVFFLGRLETRVKRGRVLGSLRALRALAHIIDMHQLTKDPERIAGRGGDTLSSPPRTLDAFQLTRYLDYCTELLALLSKVAALHVQEFDDAEALAAVNEIEDLTNGLSRQIWQKIVVLDRMLAQG